MLVQASGRTNGLRALLKSEQERGSDFLRLANALSALYPKQSEEKRLLDAMLVAEHYGFTDEELDLIINYDIKYRMGRDVETDDE